MKQNKTWGDLYEEAIDRDIKEEKEIMKKFKTKLDELFQSQM